MVKPSSTSFISSTNPEHESELSKKLYDISGYYANDFYYPATQCDNVFEIWSDESKKKNYFGVSLVVYDIRKQELIAEPRAKIFNLINEYNLEDIHFTDIFGNKNILKDKSTINDFIYKFIDIIKPLHLDIAITAQLKSDIEKRYKLGIMTEEMIHYNLFWEQFNFLSTNLPDKSCVIIFKEVSNNYSDKYTIDIFNKLHYGIESYFKANPTSNLSICKYPKEFSKRSLLESAITDFVAYAGTSIQIDIDKGLSAKKNYKKNGLLIDVFKECFEITIAPSVDFIKIINPDSPIIEKYKESEKSRTI